MIRFLARSLLVFSGLLVAYGVWALREGEKSAEHGGGLLSGFGYIPIGLGLILGLCAGAALMAVRVSRSRSPQ